MVEHADFFVEAQRVVERQYVDKRAQPDGACALYRACQKYAWARRHSEWGRVVLGKMIAVETRPFDQFEKTQTLLEKATQWTAVTVEMVEDREIQHAANSVTPPPNAANLAGRWSIKTARGRTFMRKILFCLVAAVLAASSANAQQTVKIGLIIDYSWQFADNANQMDNGLQLYIKKHGERV